MDLQESGSLSPNCVQLVWNYKLSMPFTQVVCLDHA